MGKKVNKIHSPSFLLFQPAFCLFPHCGVEFKLFASFLYPCAQMVMKKISHKFYQGAQTWIISVISAGISLELQKFGPTFSSFNPCPFLPTLGARGFSCAVSGFGQVLKSDPREKLRRSCLRASAEHVSACGRRNEAPRRTREKTSGTQGNPDHLIHPSWVDFCWV